MISSSEQNRERTVLLIGGSGYIGGAVTHLLLREGLNVVNLDFNIYDHQLSILAHMLHPNYSFIHGDMGNRDVLHQALAKATDVVVLAGLVGDPITKKYPAEAHDVNDISVQFVLDNLDGRDLQNVIFVSTCSNYGCIVGDELADEEHELNPLSLYAKSKVAAEKRIMSLTGKVDFHPTVLRFATAFGLAPRMRFDLTINEFIKELYLGKELEVFDAETWRPYCHVRDFARLILHVLNSPSSLTSFKVFNAGSNKNNFTKQGIVDLIQQHLPASRVKYLQNSDDPRNYRVNFDKLERELGFQCQYSVGDGIEEILDALSKGLFEDIPGLPNFYGNYSLESVFADQPRIA